MALVLATASPAVSVYAAQPPSKSEQLATQAKKAYDEAQFDRAFDLYTAALRAEPSKVAYLYAAARAAHQAGKLDRAEEMYLQALKAPDLSGELRERCATYLDAIATTRAEARAQEAEALQRAGRYAEAADVWRGAAALQPSRAIYLCRAGRAARLAGDEPAALRDYTVCRDKARPDTADHAEALRVLQELGVTGGIPEPKKAVAGSGPEPRQVAAGSPPPAGPGREAVASVARPAATSALSPAWAAIGGGAALLAAGAGVVAWASGDETALNDKIDARVGGKVTEISYEDAQIERDGINVRYGLGWGAVGLGAAAVGVGTWLYVRGSGSRTADARRSVLLLPTATGALLAVPF